MFEIEHLVRDLPMSFGSQLSRCSDTASMPRGETGAFTWCHKTSVHLSPAMILTALKYVTAAPALLCALTCRTIHIGFEKCVDLTETAPPHFALWRSVEPQPLPPSLFSFIW